MPTVYTLLLTNGTTVQVTSLRLAQDLTRNGATSLGRAVPATITLTSLLHRFDSPLAGKE